MLRVMAHCSPCTPPWQGDVLGQAYGSIEGMLAAAQVALALALGLIRDTFGFMGAFFLFSVGCLAALVISCPLMARTKTHQHSSRTVAPLMAAANDG